MYYAVRDFFTFNFTKNDLLTLLGHLYLHWSFIILNTLLQMMELVTSFNYAIAYSLLL